MTEEAHKDPSRWGSIWSPISNISPLGPSGEMYLVSQPHLTEKMGHFPRRQNFGYRRLFFRAEGAGVGWRWASRVQLGAPTYPQARVKESFLEEQAPIWDAEEGCDLQPKPSWENYEVWLERQGCHVNTLEWWEELMAISNVENYRKLTQKIWASFVIPKARCEALKVTNDYSVPPAPKCIGRSCSCWPLTQGCLARIAFWSNLKRLWLMLKLYSTGWKKANLLSPGKPCWLAKCVQELKRGYEAFYHLSQSWGPWKGSCQPRNACSRGQGATWPGTPQPHNSLCQSHDPVPHWPHQLLNQQLSRKQRELWALCPPTGLRSTHLTQLPL